MCFSQVPRLPKGIFGNHPQATGKEGQGPSTWKQEGHMVMETSGRRERKYCQRRGGGQRLMRTSRRLMERSTDRLTTTGTNSEPPCCSMGRREAGGTGALTQPWATHVCGSWSQNLWGWLGRTPETSPAGYLSKPASSYSPCWSSLVMGCPPPPPPAPLTGNKFLLMPGSVNRRHLRPPIHRPCVPQHLERCPHLKAQLCHERVIISHGVHGLIQPQSLGIWRGLVKDGT